MIPELLRDGVWQFVGAAAGVLAIIVSIVVTRRSRSRKELTYFIRSTPLLTVDEAIRDQIRILYRDSPITDARLIEFGITNSGNVAVRPEDFVRPIEFDFGEEAQILSASVVKTKPEDLGAAIEWPGSDEEPPASKVPLTPLLLNRGDRIWLKCLVSGSPGWDVLGRVADVPVIRQQRDTPAWIASAIAASVGLAFGVAASALDQWLLLLVPAVGPAILWGIARLTRTWRNNSDKVGGV